MPDNNMIKQFREENSLGQQTERFVAQNLSINFKPFLGFVLPIKLQTLFSGSYWKRIL